MLEMCCHSSDRDEPLLDQGGGAAAAVKIEVCASHEDHLGHRDKK